MVRLTAKDYRVFKAEVAKWLNTFGLKDWEVYCGFNQDYPENRGTCAASSLEDRIAVITLTKLWPGRPTPREVARVAFHEVMELLMMPLRLRLSGIADVSDRMLDEEFHRIIRTLESVLAPMEEPKSPKVKSKVKAKVRRRNVNKA